MLVVGVGAHRPLELLPVSSDKVPTHVRQKRAVSLCVPAALMVCSALLQVWLLR
jgi:hypothetical protein